MTGGLNSTNKLYAHKIQQFFTADDMAVDHIEDLQFPAVQFICSCRTTVFDQNDIETFIRQTAHR